MTVGLDSGKLLKLDLLQMQFSFLRVNTSWII